MVLLTAPNTEPSRQIEVDREREGDRDRERERERGIVFAYSSMIKPVFPKM
jgi:hypothetical protein